VLGFCLLFDKPDPEHKENTKRKEVNKNTLILCLYKAKNINFKVNWCKKKLQIN
jgi:hypothetical protein